MRKKRRKVCIRAMSGSEQYLPADMMNTNVRIR